MINTYTVLGKNLNGIYNLEKPGVGYRIILKWLLGIQFMGLSSELFWLRPGISDEFL
jgi:hypothetical protein